MLEDLDLPHPVLFRLDSGNDAIDSGLKSDMAVKRLPSSSMQVIALVLTLSVLAFNTLRFIGQRALAKPDLLPARPEVARKRLPKVVTDLLLLGCKLVEHRRQLVLRVWKDNP